MRAIIPLVFHWLDGPRGKQFDTNRCLCCIWGEPLVRTTFVWY